MSRPDGDGGNVITCTHDGLAEHRWEPPRCPVAIPWAVRAAAAAADLRGTYLDPSVPVERFQRPAAPAAEGADGDGEGRACSRCTCGGKGIRIGWADHARGCPCRSAVDHDCPEPRSPVDEMVRLSAKAGLYGDMGAARTEGDPREQLVDWLLNLTGRNLHPTDADREWLGNEADDLLALPALQRLVEQAAGEMTEAGELRARLQFVEHDLEHVVRERDQAEAEAARLQAAVERVDSVLILATDAQLRDAIRRALDGEGTDG